MKTIQRIRKIGNSFYVHIPKDVAGAEGILSGDNVLVKVSRLRKAWFGAFPGLKPFNKEEDRFRSRYE